MNSTDFHFQDWALIVEALAQWAGNPNELETPREGRAWELIEAIAAYLGVPHTDRGDYFHGRVWNDIVSAASITGLIRYGGKESQRSLSEGTHQPD